MNGKTGNLAVFISILLLISFNGNFVGAENDVGEFTEKEREDIGEVEVEEKVEEAEVKEVEIIEEAIEVVYENEDLVEESNVSEGIGEVFEDVVNESLEVETNFSVEIVKNTTFENKSVFENVSEPLDYEVNNSEFEYINIDELVEEVEKVAGGKEVVEKRVLKELVKDGRIELEFEIFEGDDVEILKKEVGRGDNEKDVLISSDEHFDDEVRVFSDLPSPASRENIIVNWENEGEEVFDLEYFDSDNDGLMDRISWVVPHLSTQHYSINIIVNGDRSENELNVDVIAPNNDSTVSNPVYFEFDIDYINLSEVECELLVDSASLYLFGESGDEFSWDFKEGVHNWNVFCSDGEKNDSVGGSFNVEDLFELTMDDFFLKGEGVGGNVNANGGIVEIILIKPDLTEIVLENLSGSFPQDFDINVLMLGDAGNYSIKAVSYFYDEPTTIVKSFDLGLISLDFDSSVNVGEVVSLGLNTDVTIGGVYDLYVGTSRVKNNGVFGQGFGSVSSFNYTPNSVGNFDIKAEVTINGVRYYIDGGSLGVESGVDDIDPDVDLIFPDWEDEVTGSEIEFRYEVDEDNGIENCSFKLYNTTKDSNGVHQTDDLLFPISSGDDSLALEDDISDGEEIGVQLIDFDNGDYIWEVRCIDSVGNEGWDFNYFSVNVKNSTKKVVSNDEIDYEKKEEVEALINSINSFLEKVDNFGLEERRILEILGLDRDMAFWKKRVVQMDQDLKFNLKFMEEEKREKRIEEIYEEIEEIRESVILDVESVDSYEFSKGSVDLDFVDVLGNYMEASETEISNGALKNLANYNKELQKNIDVSAEVWKLELDYLEDGKKEIVLVSKNLDISGGDDLKVLEILDKNRDVVFVSNVNDLGDNIYSVDVSNLEGGNLVYYFEKGFALKEVEKMESILFGEGSASGGFGITGMFIGVGESINMGSFFWLPLFLFIGYFGFLIFGKVRLENWKKEPGVEEIVRLINDMNVLIREGKVEAARDNYRKMSEIYVALPEKCKGFFYKEISRVRLSIDKKDVLGLIREYEVAKDEFRRDDAVLLHGKINKIYKKLPKKFQERVYRRLVKKEV